MTLSLFTVTKAEPYAARFLAHLIYLADVLGAECVIAADGPGANSTLRSWVRSVESLPPHTIRCVKSLGFLESVHDEVLAMTSGDYVFRLDDDERCSPALIRWLHARGYEDELHWKFGRAHLWGDERTMLVTPQLWPDHQTRLSKRELAGGRDHLHAGSPHGGGAIAPGVILHYKFLVKSVAERQSIADRYEALRPGYGTTSSMYAFSVPEKYYTAFPTAALGEGDYYALRGVET